MIFPGDDTVGQGLEVQSQEPCERYVLHKIGPRYQFMQYRRSFVQFRKPAHWTIPYKLQSTKKFKKVRAWRELTRLRTKRLGLFQWTSHSTCRLPNRDTSAFLGFGVITISVICFRLSPLLRRKKHIFLIL